MNSKIKILVVEDDPMTLNLLKFRLQKEGYEVLLAKDGKEAQNHLGQNIPNLILSDIMMPHLNGLELTSYVRNELKSDVPLILLSVAGQEEMVVKAFELGADDFIAKPFNPNELVIRIKRITQKNI